ncbi:MULTISPECIES: dTDP-glucose 4,6-dehydratase [Bacillus cereus group]|nr:MULTISPECIES: dTDP-glucose 4,6-dehydratase [Bacillus cereus group]PEC35918.1 dTDP-glucose 4,6-dehydratase [Bacillus toyonensis]PED60433.1 dTDP-glucose 4,6-dehydratase [Bacillus toyonensis]PEI66817.1 dTDP-glucose 4,6-dehydratase [Bacillus toyonensis]PEK05360.1 dTDP-glucose 4,6-dehydratase [Bacillus toyonensis]PEL00179.1 dTDP-glucose 4,6-dehydratase [Bacillus toyonensis]
MRYLITGGAGFIGSNFLNTFVNRCKNDLFINIDNLSYAGNLQNLKEIEGLENLIFEKTDIRDYNALEILFKKYNPDIIVHFAAESHVDRSIKTPKAFLETNIIGTFNLLELCRKYWKSNSAKLFHHISTDEVYGSLGTHGLFKEETPYNPRSPYSVSKAASDHLVKAYYNTYGIPVKVTNCSNNYGPYQFPEKLIPLTITNILSNKPIPVYGDGTNVRDWLYVKDHCEAIWAVIEKGTIGDTYNIGGNNEKSNLEVVTALCNIVAELLDENPENYLNLITHISDRPGHDFRYAIDSTKIQKELNWKPKETFESGLRKTAEWYLDNSNWLESVVSGEYQRWIDKNYNGYIKGVNVK